MKHSHTLNSLKVLVQDTPTIPNYHAAVMVRNEASAEMHGETLRRLAAAAPHKSVWSRCDKNGHIAVHFDNGGSIQIIICYPADTIKLSTRPDLYREMYFDETRKMTPQDWKQLREATTKK